MTLAIGQWVKLPGKRKWHVVESLIAGDAITRCGRRLRDEAGLQVSALMPLTRMIGQPQLCKAGCEDTVGDGAPEDDGSTANEVAES
jgi:hypothetical protein